MGVALFLIGILAILAGIVMFIIALIRKKGWGVVRSLVIGGVGLILAIIGMVVGIAQEVSKPETISPTAPSTATATEIGKSRFSPVPFGVSLTYQDERATVLNSKRLRQIGYTKSEQGTIFLVVAIKVEFLGDPQQKKNYLFSTKYRVVGNKGVIYNTEWYPETDTPLKSGEFYGGATTSGDLVYKIDEQDTNFVLIWNCSLGVDRYLEIR